MAVADVPVPPLSCGDATLADCLTLCCLSCHACFDALHGSEDGGVSLTLLDDEPVADLVGCGHVVWKFVHETIIGTGWSDSGVMVDSCSTEQQGSDCLNPCLLCLDGHPCHGLSHVGASPDHSILIVGCCQLVGVVDVSRPVATPLVKGAEGLGLDSEVSGEHVLSVLLLLVYRVRGGLPAQWWTVRLPSHYGQGWRSRRERQPLLG